jgi:uncharacterized membrane protein
MVTDKRLAMAAALISLVLGGGCSTKKAVSFEQDVKPVLQKYCLACHSASGRGYAESGFSVESYSDVMKGTKFGPVIVPGSSVSSTLQRLIEHKAHPSLNMPEGGVSLAKEQVEIIRVWIDKGAKND